MVHPLYRLQRGAQAVSKPHFFPVPHSTWREMKCLNEISQRNEQMSIIFFPLFDHNHISLVFFSFLACSFLFIMFNLASASFLFCIANYAATIPRGRRIYVSRSFFLTFFVFLTAILPPLLTLLLSCSQRLRVVLESRHLVTKVHPNRHGTSTSTSRKNARLKFKPDQIFSSRLSHALILFLSFRSTISEKRSTSASGPATSSTNR